MLFSIHFYWVEFHLNVFKSNAKVKRNFQLFADCTSKQNYSSMKTICKTDPLLLCFHLKKVFFVDGISSFIKFIWQVKLFQWRFLQIYWMNKLNKAFYFCLQKNCFSVIPFNVGHSIMISLFFSSWEMNSSETWMAWQKKSLHKLEGETNGNVRADSQVRDIPKAKISKCKNIQLQKITCSWKFRQLLQVLDQILIKHWFLHKFK